METLLTISLNLLCVINFAYSQVGVNSSYIAAAGTADNTSSIYVNAVVAAAAAADNTSSVYVNAAGAADNTSSIYVNAAAADNTSSVYVNAAGTAANTSSIYVNAVVAAAAAADNTSSIYVNAAAAADNTSSIHEHHDPTNDSQRLYDAIIGLMENEEEILTILTNRTFFQRRAILTAYSEMYNMSLIDDLRDDSSGNFKSVVHALMLEPYVLLARTLKMVLDTFMSDEEAVNEILCTRHQDDLQKIMDAFQEQYNNKTLKRVVDKNLDGDMKRFIKHILTDKLRSKGEINTTKANEQVTYIPSTKDFCTIEENRNLMEFLAKESFEQIALVAELHENTKNKSMFHHLTKYCDEDEELLDSYVTVVRYAMDPITYYAQELYDALIGLGTDDAKLIRIIVGRSEIDLFNITTKYQDIYNITLAYSIETSTTGDYRKILLRLIEQSQYTGVSQSLYG